MNIGTAIEKPFGNIKTMIIGIILMIIPVVNILVIPGYLIRVASRTMNNDNTLPSFGNFGELIVDSIKYFVISIVMLIPAIIVLFIALGSVIISTISADAISALNTAVLSGSTVAVQEQLTTLFLAGMSAGAAFIVLGVILAVIGMILIISGVLNYAKTRQFGKAFAIKENLRNFFTGKFLIAIIVAIVLSIVLAFIVGLVVGLMSMLAAVGLWLGLIIMLIFIFVIDVMIWSILAGGYPHGAVATVAPAKQVQ